MRHALDVRFLAGLALLGGAGAAQLGAQTAVEPAAAPTAAEGPAAAAAAAAGERRGPVERVELEAFLDGLMAAHMDEKRIAGATVAVVRDGEVLLAKGYGYADVAAEAPVDPERTLFRIGSVSKLFTWTAVMQLVERGELDLDADINDYVDFEIPERYGEPITLRHLLTHTAGFEERALGLFSTSTEPRGEWLAANMPARVRPPGSFSAYSNYGTALAGYIVERASGLSWDEFIERNIFEPLGMRSTTGRQPLPAHLEDRMSVGYANEGSRVSPREFEVLVPVAPAGSISATAADMARFMIAHLQNGEHDGVRILEEETARWMHRRAFGHDERLNGFALGFYEKSAHGLRVIGHGGDTQWFHTDMALVPEESLGVFVSYNTQAGGELSFGPFFELFLEHYYGGGDGDEAGAGASADAGAGAGAGADAAAEVDLSPYVGTYRVNRSAYTTLEKAFGLVSPIRVTADAESNELVIRTFGDETRFVSTGSSGFRAVDGSGLAAFRQDEAGRVTHMFLGAAPMMAMERLAWHQSPTLHLVVLGLALLVLLSALLLVPARYALQRKFAEVRPLAGRERWARWLAVAVAALNIGAVVGLGLVFGDISRVLNGELGGVGFFLLLPVLAAALTLGLLWFAATAWRTGMWGRWGRIHYTAVSLSAVAFALVLNYWNLLGWRF